MSQGDVLREGKGRKGDPYRYWAPVPDEADEFLSAHLPVEFGQEGIEFEDDYPRSATDPDASADDPQAETWIAGPIPAPSPGVGS
jgi:hypothetical protein